MNGRDCFHCGSSDTRLVRTSKGVREFNDPPGPIELRRCQNCNQVYEFYVNQGTTNYHEAIQMGL